MLTNGGVRDFAKLWENFFELFLSYLRFQTSNVKLSLVRRIFELLFQLSKPFIFSLSPIHINVLTNPKWIFLLNRIICLESFFMSREIDESKIAICSLIQFQRKAGDFSKLTENGIDFFFEISLSDWGLFWEILYVDVCLLVELDSGSFRLEKFNMNHIVLHAFAMVSNSLQSLLFGFILDISIA